MTKSTTIRVSKETRRRIKVYAAYHSLTTNEAIKRLLDEDDHSPIKVWPKEETPQ